jgi:hypothetical protein
MHFHLIFYKMYIFTERLQSDRNRHKEDLRDTEQVRQKEVTLLRFILQSVHLMPV